MVNILRTLVIAAIATTASAQPATDAIANRAVEVLGGAAWSQARYFSFTYNVEIDGKVMSSFPQRWDRVTGDYRVSGKDPQGRAFEIIMNANTKKGTATLNGQPVTSPTQQFDVINNIGVRRYANDTFWLLMPLRMTEAGVTRENVGERSDSCGRVWDVLKVTFPQGALTPGDVYWAWVNRDTGIVDEWDMKLPLMGDARPNEIAFHDFRRVGGLYLSTYRQIRGSSQAVRFTDLQILPTPPKGAFQ